VVSVFAGAQKLADVVSARPNMPIDDVGVTNTAGNSEPAMSETPLFICRYCHAALNFY